MDEEYYVSQGGKIPVKWTAPEVLLHASLSNQESIRIPVTTFGSMIILKRHNQF